MTLALPPLTVGQIIAAKAKITGSSAWLRGGRHGQAGPGVKRAEPARRKLKLMPLP